MALVWAFDPGATTGWASAYTTWPPQIIETANIHTLEELASYFDKRQLPDAIIVEDFVIWAKTIASGAAGTRRVLTPVLVIGSIQMLAHLKNVPIKYSQPNIAPMWPDGQLRKMGISLRGRSPHEKSAIRHICHYLLTTNSFR